MTLTRQIELSNKIDKQFFEKAFTDPTTNKPYSMPDDIKRLASRLCRSYGIRGICDPMYIANIIALELGLGDGQGNFSTKTTP